MSGSNPSHRQSILRGSAVTLVSRIAQAVLAFGSLALMARLLSAPDMGIYFLAMSVSGLGTLLLPMGMQGVVLRDVSRAMQTGNITLAAGLTRSALLKCAKMGGVCIVAAAGAVVTIHLASGSLRVPRMIIVVALFAPLHATLTSMQVLIADAFRAIGKTAAAATWNGPVPAGLNFLALAGAAASGISMTLEFALAWLAASQAIALGGALATMPMRREVLAGPAAKLSLRKAQPFWLNGLAIYVFMQCDLWIAALILPLHEVAVYGAATRLFQLLLMPLEATEGALPHRIVQLHACGETKRLERLLQQAGAGQTLAMTFGWLLLAIAGDWIFGRIFDSPLLQSSIAVALVLGVGGLVRASAGAYPHLLLLCHRERQLTRIHLGCAFVCIPVGLIATWFLGIYGTAMSAALILATASVCGAIYAQRELGIAPSVLQRYLRQQT